eukprot:GHVU01087397.1.p3 GENE.GHVU01087397.1~~GHVU01087397.1.p3  ORF type:complete len:149 (+),score=38.54 GHVU01087397.1:1060-1506(+)
MAMSKRREVAIEAINAFGAWDIERIMACGTEDCIHHIVPSSLNRPEQSNAEFRAYFSGIMPLFKNFTPTIKTIVEDDAANTVAIWCSSKADSVIGPYGNEYMILLHFNPEGDKVTRFVEFIDTAFSKDFFGRLGKWAAEKKGAEGASK